MQKLQEPAQLTLKEAFDLYEDGKHRRYSLLFSVHGGAFAIVKFLTADSQNSSVVLGGLSLLHLSLGMALFTLIMIWDIWGFGEKIRTSYLSDAFGAKGKAVLLSLGLLLCLGWLLVATASVFSSL